MSMIHKHIKILYIGYDSWDECPRENEYDPETDVLWNKYD